MKKYTEKSLNVNHAALCTLCGQEGLTFDPSMSKKELITILLEVEDGTNVTEVSTETTSDQSTDSISSEIKTEGFVNDKVDNGFLQKSMAMELNKRLQRKGVFGIPADVENNTLDALMAQELNIRSNTAGNPYASSLSKDEILEQELARRQTRFS